LLTLIPLCARIWHPSTGAAHETEGARSIAAGRTLPRMPWRPIAGVIAALAPRGRRPDANRVGTGFFRCRRGGFVSTPPPAGMALEDTNVWLKRPNVLMGAEVATSSSARVRDGMFATQQNSGDILVRLKARGAL
jgi:hypothetical protein